MSPPSGPSSGGARRFVLATEGAADDWLRKASAGEPVTAGERNAFVTQAGAAMDALADPTIIRAIVAGDAARAEAAALDLPRVPYNGPVRHFNGQQVPLIGSVNPPPEWFGKRDGSSKTSGEVGGGAKPPGLLEVLAPTNAERRSMYLATSRVLQSLRASGEVVSDVRRPAAGVDAGLAPVAVGAIVVCVVAIVSWAVYLYEQTQIVTIRENAETARQAAELRAAQAAWMQRVQTQLQNPGQPMPPPSPAEVRVTGRPYPATPSPAEDGATRFLSELAATGKTIAIVGGLGLVAVTAGPPVIANLADRLTRPREARGG